MAEKTINGVKVTICPPGPIRSDLLFQAGGAHDRNLGRKWASDPNPPDVVTPREMTLEEAFGVTALSLREIMTEGED